MTPSDKFAPSGLSEEEKRAIAADEILVSSEMEHAVGLVQAIRALDSMPVPADGRIFILSARRRFGIDWD